MVPWAGETELRLNANQLFVGVVASGLWIYSLAQTDWVSAGPVNAGLFSLAVAVNCNGTTANATGTWGDVCNVVLTNRSSCFVLSEMTIVAPLPTNRDVATVRAICSHTDARVQVAYLLITATVFSLIALCVGVSFLLRDVLVSKHVAALPSLIYFVSALFGMGAVLHWHVSFTDVLTGTGSGYVLAIVSTVLLTLVALSMVVTGCLPGLCAITGEPRPMAQQGFGLRLRRTCIWCSRTCRRRPPTPYDAYRSMPPATTAVV
ncbi:hypothetical protein SDRG_13250 [Saprolegnia diclina VS20]|uniref:Transmembrane protein n=1 Tax=Saprolegnia diclina (strain VS20) TaxID=1156394 RepID=T0Q6K4_SAPDV|nr:hypothetical protein SDRG_13250 [Saprolegnia diclina VS20]EQC29090.1 hypothetical protein SDRG_13250 [Saprolegnia diclina VS20]|eukprot:XP_008617549.1 hypothetical protein SDRG_13250 [Saprolegnia diclina VS20]